jgi:endonuclease YncB( thermonuclease family)
VRIIGIDAPERGECGYDEASALVASLLRPGDAVVLQLPDGENDQDQHGRPSIPMMRTVPALVSIVSPSTTESIVTAGSAAVLAGGVASGVGSAALLRPGDAVVLQLPDGENDQDQHGRLLRYVDTVDGSCSHRRRR